MKKFNLGKFKLRKVNIDEIDDRMLLINLYGTQALTLIIGLIWIFFQHQSLFSLFAIPKNVNFVYWVLGLGVIVLAVDIAISRFVPDEVGDDGGVNERIFKNRPWWHIILLSFIVAICEETLFRGAIQHSIGPYWTSILFATIHVRYLRHWIPTGLVFSISYGLGWAYEQTGTLWTPIIAHFLIDAVMGFIIRYRKER
ncbi:CPBP family intramembrane glutamic endopeptidase [Paenibacillus sp. GCM10027626]|uniref:CPBP family intramembrane glutamic endopeptidase n=1 Tax=Paenibacillus sp. GCM10027626 TaxID=3273411 RepID=UPI00362C6FE7